MNTTFPHIYSKLKGVAVLITMQMYQNAGAVEFCAVGLDSAAELEVSVSHSWLPALSHFCRARHLALSVIAAFRSGVNG